MPKNKTFVFSVLISFIILGMITFSPDSWGEKEKINISQYEEVSVELARKKRCLSCHEGIEVINERMAKSWGADTKCEVCHLGDPLANKKEAAHKGMITYSGDFRYMDQTCGQCHDDKGKIRKEVEGLIPGVVRLSRVVSRGERNHVPRSLRKSMSHAGGEIAVMRYLWGAQKSTKPLYGTIKMESLTPAFPPQAAVKELGKLPGADSSNVDSLLRTHCLKCHQWTRGENKYGSYRASGCDSCHVLYADDGLSKTKDPTISKIAPGHPVKHEITVKIPSSQCLRCHQWEGHGIGPGYTGQIYGYFGTPFTEEDTAGSGMKVRPIYTSPDVHYEKGLECLDCHGSKDVHGDGNIYIAMAEETKIRCESCHGTPYQNADLKDKDGKLLPNLYRQGEDVIQEGKMNGKKFRVPQLKRMADHESLPFAMKIPAHLKEIKDRNTLECYSCHSLVVPQYYGFNFKRDDQELSYIDWVEGKSFENGFHQGSWSKNFTYLQWNDPVFGINSKGKVSPLVPIYQSIFTHINDQGKTVALKSIHKSPDTGQSLMGFTPTQPHRVNKKALTCAYCHNNSKALGLGSLEIDTKSQGWEIDFGLDRIVNEQGIPVQTIVYPKARPFNEKELKLIDRKNLCNGCHSDMDNEDLWKKITDPLGFAKTNKQHKEIIDTIFIRNLPFYQEGIK